MHHTDQLHKQKVVIFFDKSIFYHIRPCVTKPHWTYFTEHIEITQDTQFPLQILTFHCCETIHMNMQEQNRRAIGYRSCQQLVFPNIKLYLAHRASVNMWAPPEQEDIIQDTTVS